MWYDIHVENMLNIKRSSRNLAAMGITEKNNFFRQFSWYHQRNQGAEYNFYSLRTWSWTVLLLALSTQIVLFSSKIERVFVPKFYHEKRARNFRKHLVYVGKHGPDKTRCQYREVGRKYYEYKKSTDVSSKSVLATDSDWPFPETCYKSIGSTVRGFDFFPKLIWFSKKFNPTIIEFNNIESGTGETSTVPTQYSFYPGKQQIEENIKNNI